MCEFGEYVEMFDYTKKAVEDILFNKWEKYDILPCAEWTDDYIFWQESNMNTKHTMKKDVHGYEVINGTGFTQGKLLGGCIDVFLMVNGTKIWPTIEEWKDTILFIETSEDKPSPDFIKWTLRNLAIQGVLNVINGIIVGKPQAEKYYEEYKTAIMQVVVNEEKLNDMPIFYNINFGHAKPIGVIPNGIKAESNCSDKTIVLLECPTI